MQSVVSDDGFNGADHLQGHGYANGPVWASLQRAAFVARRAHGGERAGRRGDWAEERDEVVTSERPPERLLLPAAGSRGFVLHVCNSRTPTLHLAGFATITIKFSKKANPPPSS